MLINRSRLINCPVLSLHVGGPIARTVAPIIDPSKLQVIALTVQGPQTGTADYGDILDLSSVREFSRLGMVVDSIDEFVSAGEVVKIDKALDLNFDPIALKVETRKGTKLGRVIDYTLDSDTFTIQQLTVQRPALKSFLDPELVISRREIVEVNDRKIIVKDEKKSAITTKSTTVKSDFVPNFVNPFRQPSGEPQYAPTDNQTPAAPNKQ